MLHHSQQPRIAAEQILPEVRSALNEELLILTVGDFSQPPHQQSIAVVLDEAVPIATPDNLDHIPAGTAENRLQLLNNFSVATYRTVEPLQIAVDHPDQVVELFSRRQRDGAQRLGLVHFAIAEKCPDLPAGAGL